MELHRRNTRFEWTDLQGPFEVVTKEQCHQFDEGGYFVIENAFSTDELKEIKDAICPFERLHQEELRQRKEGHKDISKASAITFTAHLVDKSEVLKKFSKHPIFQKLCRDLLGPQVRLYWDQAVYKKPGNPEEFPWHQDNGYTYLEPQNYLTCWVPLVDATAENGCPWVAPGLHRLGTLKHEWTDLGWQCLSSPDAAIPVPVKAGDIVVFSSLTPHRTGPNLTDKIRKAYILQYAPDGAIAYPHGSDEAVLQANPDWQYFVSD